MILLIGLENSENRFHRMGTIAKIKVFLIALYPKKTFPIIGESQGICAISGFLQSKYPKDVETRLFDQQINTDEEIISAILQERPGIIGFSVKMGTLSQLRILYNRLFQDVFPLYKPIIVLGNSAANFHGNFLLKEFPDAIISKGEGEITFNDLILYLKDKIKFEKIGNIVYLKNGILFKSGQRYLDPNDIENADRRNTLCFYNKDAEIYIEGSRGCGYCGCSICECRDFLGSRCKEYRWRGRPLAKILSELHHLEGLGIEEVTFSDEDFIGPDDIGIGRAISFAHMVIDNNIHIHYRINIRVRSLANNNDDDSLKKKRRQLISILKQSGLSKVFLGFESGSETQLRRYNKGFDLSEFLLSKSLLDEMKIDYELGYICLDPLMSLKELKESLVFISENNCISHISNIYKELRIQSGNQIYLNKIRKCEQESHVHIIGELNHDEQTFPVLSYIDNNIELLRKCLMTYEQRTYRLYYFMRILTQYDTLSNHIKEYVYKTMSSLKYNDYSLLQALVSQLEQDSKDTNSLREIVEEHERSRNRIYRNLHSRLPQAKFSGYWEELYFEVYE